MSDRYHFNFLNAFTGHTYSPEVKEPLINQQPVQTPSLPVLSTTDVDNVVQPPAPQFTIEEVVFPTKIWKKQSRLKNVDSVQRVPNEESEIRINLIFQVEGAWQIIERIQIKLHHKNYKSTDIIGRINQRMLNPKTYRIQFDMDDVKDNTVFELEKTPKEEKKKFFFSITAKYSNGAQCTRNTNEFVILGSKPRDSPKNTGAKRRRYSVTDEAEGMRRTKSNSFDSVESHDSGIIGSPNTPYQDQKTRVAELVAEAIETKTLTADVINGQQFKTPRHDVGYCFFKLNEDEEFAEGEVVGLLRKKDNNGVDLSPDDQKREVCAAKLTRETAEKTILKGVITKDPYITAYCPSTEEKKSTVILAMLGIVPVKVIGSVKPNEALYASEKYPGVAISEYHLSPAERRDRSFVGIAFSSHDTKDEETIGFVEAGVSILQNASQTLVDKKLDDLEEGLSVQIYDVRKSHRSWKKCSTITVVLLMILFALIGIFMWQLYQPGSAFRKYMCRRGHLKPVSKAWFTYVPLARPYLVVESRGIEFDFDVLIKKVSHTNYRRLSRIYNGTITVGKARYYRNIERCAYGDGQEYIHNGKRIQRGPDMFAVDENCFYVFYWHDVKNYWEKYNSADWFKFKNVHCNPPSRYKDEQLLARATVN